MEPLRGVVALEDGHRRAGVVPGEARVDVRGIAQRLRRPGSQVDHEQPVGVLLLRIHGVCEQIPLPVERGIADAAEELTSPGGQVHQDGVRALFRRGSAAAGSAAEATCARGGAIAQESEPGVAGEGGRLHVVPDERAAGRELPELDSMMDLRFLSAAASRAGASVGVRATAAALRRRVHLEDDPTGVGRKHSVRGLGEGRVATVREAQHVQLGVLVVLRHVRVAVDPRHPAAIAGDRLVPDGAPAGIVGDGQDPLRGVGAARREGSGRGRRCLRPCRARHEAGRDKGAEEGET